MSVVIYVAVCVRATQVLTWHLSVTLSPWLSVTGFPPYSPADLICRYGLAMLYLTAPQLAAALVAGWLYERWCEQIARQSPKRQSPEAGKGSPRTPGTRSRTPPPNTR